MSDADIEDIEGEEGEEGEGAGSKRRFSGKFLILFVLLPVMALGALGGGAYVFLFSGGDEQEEAVETAAVPPPVFYELPEFVVNLSGSGSTSKYLKLRVSLEIEKSEVGPQLDVIMPRILDGFQVYLRELRAEDLDGSSGMLHLKEELLRRINLASDPTVVKDVLFQEVVIQ